MYKIALSGQMFDETCVWDHLEAAAAFGYQAVELRSTFVNQNTPDETLEQIKDCCESHGLEVIALSCFTGNYGLLTDQECEEAFEVFKQFVGIAVKLQARFIRVWPAWIESRMASEDIWERTARWLQRSADYAKQYGKRIVMEMHHGTLCDRAEGCEKILKMTDRENVGLILDAVNLYQVPVQDVPALVCTLGPYIWHVHVKDIIQLPSRENPYGFEYAFYAEHIGKFTKVVPPSQERTEYYAHRRINHGGVDWFGILKALEDVGYDGYLSVESVDEGNVLMPAGRELAKTCYLDLMGLLKKETYQKSWSIASPEVPGMHEVISPAFRDCAVSHIYRLNLNGGETYVLESGEEEMNAVLIRGQGTLLLNGEEIPMKRLDSFYIPGRTKVRISARQPCVFYIGAAICEGYGEAFFTEFDPDLPLGDMHQIHGSGSGSREVFFTLHASRPASRLICGLTWANDGQWTSWPPHQHEKDLEEVYCYFDTPMGAHLSYLDAGGIATAQFNVIKDGSFVLATKGYHPTVSMPGSRNCYFWVLTALRHESRSYDLAVTDPTIA